ncbi:hypothetical protein GA0070624_4292 [Micromonospora rhizosphaerae]|uniref:Uncharacterized protein n=1 Tax=Micromonospora rhizosphaerae TaxID=568872 RepID=A0A1C6SQL6_9ACTN|nr:hypothetical protein GA0070624_4292 [Micromonospora rhizosphaerae]
MQPLSTRWAAVAGAAFGNLACLPFAPPLLRIAVAVPADLAIAAGAGIDLAVVSIAALRLLFPAAAVLGMTDLTQVGGLNTVRRTADVVNVQLRVVVANEDNKRGDVGPRPTRHLLVHATLVTVAMHDEAAVFRAY